MADESESNIRGPDLSGTSTETFPGSVHKAAILEEISGAEIMAGSAVTDKETVAVDEAEDVEEDRADSETIIKIWLEWNIYLIIYY